MGPYDEEELNDLESEYAREVYDSEFVPDSWEDTTDEDRDYGPYAAPKPSYKRPKSKFARGKTLVIPETPGRSGLSFGESHPVGGLFEGLRRRGEDETLEEYLKAEMMFFSRFMVDAYLEGDPKLQWDPAAVDRMDFLCRPKIWKRICRWFELTDDEYIKYFQ